MMIMDTSKTILNKAAMRPKRVLVTRVVVLYRCRETGVEHQKWLEMPIPLLEGDKLHIEVNFDDFAQTDG